MTARVTLLAGADQAVEQAITVPPFDRATLDVSAAITAPFVSAMVEIDGGGGLVEQRRQSPAGTSAASSDRTVHDRDVRRVVRGRGLHGWRQRRAARADQPLRRGGDRRHRVRHPRRDRGSRRSCRDVRIAPRSVEVIDLAEIAAQDEAEVAVNVATPRSAS